MSSDQSRLLATARLLTDEEAGDHSNRWEVFAEDAGQFIADWLPVAVQNSQVVQLGVIDSTGEAELATPTCCGEPSVAYEKQVARLPAKKPLD